MKWQFDWVCCAAFSSSVWVSVKVFELLQEGIVNISERTVEQIGCSSPRNSATTGRRHESHSTRSHVHRQSDPLGTDHFEGCSRCVQLRRCLFSSFMWACWSCGGSQSHCTLWSWRLCRRCVFKIDAWPRSFVVIGFLVVREKWDDLSSTGTLSTRLRPHGTIVFRTLLRITGTVFLHRTW